MAERGQFIYTPSRQCTKFAPPFCPFLLFLQWVALPASRTEVLSSGLRLKKLEPCQYPIRRGKRVRNRPIRRKTGILMVRLWPDGQCHLRRHPVRAGAVGDPAADDRGPGRFRDPGRLPGRCLRAGFRPLRHSLGQRHPGGQPQEAAADAADRLRGLQYRRRALLVLCGHRGQPHPRRHLRGRDVADDRGLRHAPGAREHARQGHHGDHGGQHAGHQHRPAGDDHDRHHVRLAQRIHGPGTGRRRHRRAGVFPPALRAGREAQQEQFAAGGAEDSLRY